MICLMIAITGTARSERTTPIRPSSPHSSSDAVIASLMPSVNAIQQVARFERHLSLHPATVPHLADDGSAGIQAQPRRYPRRKRSLVYRRLLCMAVDARIAIRLGRFPVHQISFMELTAFSLYWGSAKAGRKMVNVAPLPRLLSTRTAPFIRS